MRGLVFALLAAVVVLLCAVPREAVAATAVAQGVQARTLFLTESFRPTSVRAPLQGTTMPEQLVAQAGEEEGFQLAIRVPQQTRLEAWVTGSEALTKWNQILRVEWVNITRPSTGMGARTGLFADPLPEQTGASGSFGAGKLLARAKQWSGYALVISVPTGQPAGTYEGQLHVRDERGTELVRQDFSLTVVATRTSQGVADPAISPHDARNFKVLFNFNPAWYRALAPAKTAQQQYEQTYRTLWMLARHRSASTNWHRAYPSGDGTYSCNAADGFLKAYNEMPWWADGKPGAIPVRLMPNNTVKRCVEGFGIRADRGTPANKYDDVIGDAGKSGWFIYRLAQQWRTQGLQDHRTYFLNPFDEPDAKQNRTVVPQVNAMVHDYAPGVKVLATTWPMRRGTQTSDNRNLSDGGKDDVDGWVAPYFRSWGFAKQGRSREVVTRLKAIQAKGGEMWTYDLPLATKRVPQMSIDSPATDARFIFWPLGREGFQGWFTAVSNRWVDAWDVTKTRNPWDDPLSWMGREGGTGPHGAISNGWGSLFYPGYRPALGLTDPLAQPVTSLRLQRLRDGVEDANLMRQYRERFGQAWLESRLTGVVGPLRDAGMTGKEAFPSYRTAGLALRMEIARRQLLADLAS